jgi:protein-S-isoprenylcysteine O-methyltransferase Ste14
MLTRFSALFYGGACYAVFLAVFVYAIGFIGGFLTPTMLDGVPGTTLTHALLVDLGLLAAFALQHSGMARPAFKRWWTRVVPEWAERSTYVLLSSLAMVALFVCWEPIGGVVWSATGSITYGVVASLYALGWIVLLYATFLIDHFDLFGLAQVWRQWTGSVSRPPQFHTPGLYRHVRHPLYVGWLMIFWAAPTMTVAHLVFAVATTAYILLAIPLEERDLIATFGRRYLEYRRTTPMLIPRISRTNPSASAMTHTQELPRGEEIRP